MPEATLLVVGDGSPAHADGRARGARITWSWRAAAYAYATVVASRTRLMCRAAADNAPDVVSILLEMGDHSDPRGECPQKTH